MALGFDMKARICEPPVTPERVLDWTSFLTRWGECPVFAGRYFSDATFRWASGEIPRDLRSRIPDTFDDLKYVWVLTSTGPYASTRAVNIYGEPVQRDVNGNWPEDSHIVIYQQQGEALNGTKRKNDAIYYLGELAAKNTCEAIASAVQRLTPSSPPADLELPRSRFVFVFLDVEPQTKLHKEYWRGWATQVRSFTINAGTTLEPRDVKPLLPCLYCAMTTEGPWLDAVRDVFADKRSPLCWAVATGWNPGRRNAAGVRERGLVYAAWEARPSLPRHLLWPDSTTGVPAYASTATDDDVQAKWPAFAELQQRDFDPAPVVIWQYHLDYKPPVPHGPFAIDVAATRAAEYALRPITDYMLKIVW